MSTSQDLVIGKPRGLLSRCIPNLMPFHIAYSGPAPISTYFRVKAAPKPEFGRSDSNETMNAEGSSATHETQTSSSSSEATLVASSSTSLSLAVHASIEEAASAPEGKTGEDIAAESSHLEAAFRGRTLRGLKVDLPSGYTGLVLRTPDDAKGKEAAAQREREKAKERAKKEKAAKRRTRGAKRAVEIEAEEDAEMELEDDHGEGDEEEAPQRVLEPVSSFSSFVLWNPDLPADEGRDEYLRALTEWTKLAAEIHRYDD